jgi:hypothetical protein
MDNYKIFESRDIEIIGWATENSNNINLDHELIHNPISQFESKESDAHAIDLWNEIFPENFRIDSIDELKGSASEFIKYIDGVHPNGALASEEVLTQYVTAQSSSSFIGIQRPKSSKFANDSIIKTLMSHAKPRLVEKPWLIPNLHFVANHIS